MTNEMQKFTVVAAIRFCKKAHEWRVLGGADNAVNMWTELRLCAHGRRAWIRGHVRLRKILRMSAKHVASRTRRARRCA